MSDLPGTQGSRYSRALQLSSSRWLKVAIALAVLALLVFFNRVNASILVKLARTWPWLIAAFVLMLPPFAIVSFRFKVILRSQGIHVRFLQAVRWTMIGSFFDLAMPSSNGGDLVKAGYVANHVGTGQRTRAVMAVAFDRLLGLLGLFLLASAMSIIGWTVLRDMPGRNLVVASTFIASIGTLILLRAAGSRRLFQSSAVNRFLQRSTWGLRGRQFIASFNSLHERPIYLFTALALSVFNHMFWCASLLCITTAVGNAIDPMKGFVVFPLAIFGNIFGIAGGFGLGTVGFDLLVSQLLSIGNGALIGLLFQSLSALSRLMGLPFFLRSPPDKLRRFTSEEENVEMPVA